MEARRSANYEPGLWSDDYIQSLTSSYKGEKYMAEAENLKTQVKLMIDQTEDESEQLELINILQRLDISNHFEDGISKILEKIYDGGRKCGDENLHLTSLRFRILRQHGFHVPQEVFCSFTDDSRGDFKACVAEDVRGLISLYEASFLSMEGESILDLAKDFAFNHLTKILQETVDEEVKHALELPLHWRVQKLEAIWFIQVYQNRSNANLNLLQLAKLDFNMTQATYQDDLKRSSRWYEETGLPRLSFARHRLAECFMWATGLIPEPHLGKLREIIAKVTALITIIDDIYDVYGTLDELRLFTDTIEGWDINSLDLLPEYMRTCFLTLFNFTNELAYIILRDQGFNVISNLRRLWAEQCRAYYVEAEWFHSGYYPTTDEYLNTAWVSAGAIVGLFLTFFFTRNSEVQMLDKNSGIIRWPSMVVRLADDLATSSDEMERGDAPKAIQCYMKETGCSEEDARKHVKQLIEAAWKRLHKEIMMEKTTLKNFGQTAMNMARISLCVYQHGDGHGRPHTETKENMVSLIVRPMPMP